MKDYDSTQIFSSYGFGGIIPDSSAVSHCFALNGDIYNPGCSHIDGVLKAYGNAIKHAKLYGPTHFSKIIRYIN